MRIRARLTLWYTAVLALCLVAFGATLWLTLRESLVTAKRAELEDRVRGFRQMFLEHAAEPDASSEALREEAGEYSVALPADFTVRLWDATVDKPLSVISNGKLLTTKENADGTRTFHWKIAAPHASYPASSRQ